MLLIAFNVAIVLQRDQIVIPACIEKRAMDVGAMGDGVGIFEALDGILAKRHVGDDLAGQGIAHFQRGRHMGILQHGVLEPDAIERAKDVWTELDTGAKFLELRGLLKNANRKALEREGIGRGETADAATGYQKRQLILICRRHANLPSSI